MATLSTLISNIRLYLPDSNDVRWTDANLLTLIGKAVRVINRELYQQGITFARSSATFTTTSGTYQYNLSSDLLVTDFMVWDSLWDTDDDDKLIHLRDDQWNDLTTLATAGYWRLSEDSAKIEIKATPTSAINMRFFYWPDIDTSSYATDTTAPWSDRCNDIIEEYVIARCKHVDEHMTNSDAVFGYNVAQSIYRTFGHYGGSRPLVSGWLD